MVDRRNQNTEEWEVNVIHCCKAEVEVELHMPRRHRWGRRKSSTLQPLYFQYPLNWRLSAESVWILVVVGGAWSCWQSNPVQSTAQQSLYIDWTTPVYPLLYWHLCDKICVQTVHAPKCLRWHAKASNDMPVKHVTGDWWKCAWRAMWTEWTSTTAAI